MTVKLVALYTRPDDPDAFDQHYFGTHMPLVRSVPGLQRVETGRFIGAADGAGQTYYRIAELYFAGQGEFEAAFSSEEGKAAAGDYQDIAPSGSRMFIEVIDD